VCPPSIDFLLAFFGCLYAGVIAVPLYPPFHPTRVTRELPRFQHVFDDCGAEVVLSTTAVRRLFTMHSVLPGGRLHTVRGGSARWLSVSDISARLHLRSGPAERAIPVPAALSGVTRSTPAFVQYSSGSTGDPKGVVLTHANLFANAGHILNGVGAGDAAELNDTVVSWLPPYHDMGLIGSLIRQKKKVELGFLNMVLCRNGDCAGGAGRCAQCADVAAGVS
jgi:acyl-CoA synthetase (AMP-forming)/AMP-acid ligase II